jgi:hypothetical protein
MCISALSEYHDVIVLKDPGVKLHLIAVIKIKSFTTRAFDLTFTSETKEIGAIGMIREAGEVGDVGETRYSISRPVIPSRQANFR